MDRCALVRAARGVPADKIVVHMPVTFDTRLFSPSLAASLREIRQSRPRRRLHIAARECLQTRQAAAAYCNYKEIASIGSPCANACCCLELLIMYLVDYIRCTG